MVETLIAVGIILFIVWFFVRRSFNYKPGSKNWAINTDTVIDELKSQYEPVVNLQNVSRDHEHRMSRVEMDLERMNAIINMYKEFANSHQNIHNTYGWAENINTTEHKSNKHKNEGAILNG